MLGRRLLAFAAVLFLAYPAVAHFGAPPPEDAGLVYIGGCTGTRITGAGNPRFITAKHCVYMNSGAMIANPRFGGLVPAVVVWTKGDLAVLEALSVPDTYKFLQLRPMALSLPPVERGAPLWMVTLLNDTSEGSKEPYATAYTPVISIGDVVMYRDWSLVKLWFGGGYRGFSGSPVFADNSVVGVLSVAYIVRADAMSAWGAMSPMTPELLQYVKEK